MASYSVDLQELLEPLEDLCDEEVTAPAYLTSTGDGALGEGDCLAGLGTPGVYVYLGKFHDLTASCQERQVASSLHV